MRTADRRHPRQHSLFIYRSVVLFVSPFPFLPLSPSLSCPLYLRLPPCAPVCRRISRWATSKRCAIISRRCERPNFVRQAWCWLRPISGRRSPMRRFGRLFAPCVAPTAELFSARCSKPPSVDGNARDCISAAPIFAPSVAKKPPTSTGARYSKPFCRWLLSRLRPSRC